MNLKLILSKVRINMTCIRLGVKSILLKFSLAVRLTRHKQRKLNDHVYSLLLFASLTLCSTFYIFLYFEVENDPKMNLFVTSWLPWTKYPEQTGAHKIEIKTSMFNNSSKNMQANMAGLLHMTSLKLSLFLTFKPSTLDLNSTIAFWPTVVCSWLLMYTARLVYVNVRKQDGMFY